MMAPAAAITEEWQGYLTSLAGLVESMGAKLVTSADGYAAADAESSRTAVDAPAVQRSLPVVRSGSRSAANRVKWPLTDR